MVLLEAINHITTRLNGELMKNIASILLFAFLALPLRIHMASEKSPVDGKEGIPFIKISTDIASQIRKGSLAGYIAIYVQPNIWNSLLNDGDIGPFLKIGLDRDNLRAVLLMPTNPKDGFTYCVYFDAADPVGIVSISPNADGKYEPNAIKSALTMVTKGMLTPCKEELHFIPGNLETDDGKPLNAFKIASSGKK